MVPGYREDIPYSEVKPASNPQEREKYWETGAALQVTDGLEVSEYARRKAGDYIAGKLTASEFEEDLRRYHSEEGDSGFRQAEADIVASRIADLLETSIFSLRPPMLFSIHASLFDGVLRDDWVGRPRTMNIEKPEPVLGGRTVQYADWRSIRMTLDYDFEQERARPYAPPLDADQVARLARFIASVWQTHAFREGNTRTIAVFSELYLRSLGADVDNEPFIRNSELYRDTLVRASFSSIELGISEDYSFVTKFYENVVLGASHSLLEEDMNVHGIRRDDEIDYRVASGFMPPSPLCIANQARSAVCEPHRRDGDAGRGRGLGGRQ